MQGLGKKSAKMHENAHFGREMCKKKTCKTGRKRCKNHKNAKKKYTKPQENAQICKNHFGVIMKCRFQEIGQKSNFEKMKKSDGMIGQNTWKKG